MMKSLLLGVSLLASPLLAQLPAIHTPADKVPQGLEILLWDGPAPQSVEMTPEDKPHMEFFGASPDAKLKDGLRTAVIVCPGEGYTQLAYDKKGTRIAEWLNLQGISADVSEPTRHEGYPTLFSLCDAD